MFLAKIILATALTYWLVRSNKLEFSLLLSALGNVGIWLISSLLVCVQIILGAIRFRAILNEFGVHVGGLRVLCIQWIGQFFSTVLPGAITGDLVKISYLNTECKKKKLLFLIILDRLFALAGLLLFVGLLGVWNLEGINILSPELYQFIVLLNSSIVVLLTFLLGGYLGRKLVKNFIISSKLAQKLQLENSLKVLNRRWLLKTMTLSVAAQAFGVMSFVILISPYLDKGIDIYHLLTFIPLGQLAIVLPISPAGFGVGHLAYDKIFKILGQSNGASLFNIYWFLISFVNILGLIPFIFMSAKKNRSDS